MHHCLSSYFQQLKHFTIYIESCLSYASINMLVWGRRWRMCASTWRLWRRVRWRQWSLGIKWRYRRRHLKQIWRRCRWRSVSGCWKTWMGSWVRRRTRQVGSEFRGTKNELALSATAAKQAMRYVESFFFNFLYHFTNIHYCYLHLKQTSNCQSI